MEYGLGRYCSKNSGDTGGSLNPCFNGIWSRTPKRSVRGDEGVDVLILVLMEYGLGPTGATVLLVLLQRSLNPCFNGIWSRTGSSFVDSRQAES